MEEIRGSGAMKVLVVGAGDLGIRVIKQLRKNPDIAVVVADHRERPTAVERGVIDKVDILEHITPMNIVNIVQDCRPDIILLARRAKDWGHGDTVMATQFIAGLERQLSRFHVPVIPVSSIVMF
ncbi:MAG: nucleoside-diphosphate sugar epimerase/dehydratase [Thermoplasmata archaeon]